MTAAGARPQVGVSSCLLGHCVRYDGWHQWDYYANTELARRFELLPFCPEVGAGLGVPRPPIHLLPGPKGWRAVRVDEPEDDVSAQLRAYAEQVARGNSRLCGYIFKSRSPSCGLRNVKVFHGAAGYIPEGTGVHAGILGELLPGLPCIEETALADASARAAFSAKVLARFRSPSVPAP